MTTEGSFVQQEVPQFDGHYDHWAMLMENFLRSKEYWGIIENGVPAAADGAVLTETQRKNIDDQKLKDLKAKNYLFQALDRSVLETILNTDTSKNIWDSMRQKYQGTTRVKRALLQTLRKEFEIIHMQEGESVNEYFARTLTIAKKMKVNGESKGDVAVIEKILRSMTSKFDYVVCSIEESRDINSPTIDELQSSLLEAGVEFVDILGEEDEDEADKALTNPLWNANVVTSWDIFKGMSKEEEENYAETQEEMLLMAQVDMNKANNEDLWFFDSGCSNHMCGKMEYFSEMDENFRDSVTLGNNSSMAVLGKGNVRLQVHGVAHIITGVFYVPDLKSNLLSIGQLQEKGAYYSVSTLPI
ncbi:uncharacterized protein [Henckelia pumila]|uniref:uncharacterized protein n=1 Tax=Henckelia pumila TaxID=405737 RepID=UPI003C6E9233